MVYDRLTGEEMSELLVLPFLGIGLLIVAFPVAVALTGHAGWEIGVIAAVAGLLVLRHVPNIRRLIHHEEIDVVRGTS